jgi:hypothetical protein
MSAGRAPRKRRPPDSRRLPRAADGAPTIEPADGSRPPDRNGQRAPELAEAAFANGFLQEQARARRARAARLRSLWQLSPAQRVAAMRRGELTLEQLAAWSARHPEQVPRVNGEFEWITDHTPEADE